MPSQKDLFLLRAKSKIYHLLLVSLLTVLVMPSPALAEGEEDAPNGETAPAETTNKPPAEPQTKKAIVVKSPEQKQMSLMADQLPTENVLWIDAPDDKFLAIYHPENSGDPAGALIIFYRLDGYGNQRKAVNEIQHALPEHGWFTLSVPILQNLSVKLAAKKAAEDKQAEEKAKEELEKPEEEPVAAGSSAPPQSVTDEANKKNSTLNAVRTKTPAERNIIRIDNTIEHFKKMGIFNVVIVASGETASTVYDYLSNHFQNLDGSSINAIQGLIVINQEGDVDNNPFKPTSPLIKQMPILDIYFGKTIKNKKARAARQRLINRNKFLNYKQISIPKAATLVTQSQPYLPNRIRAWLNTYAGGETKAK